MKLALAILCESVAATLNNVAVGLRKESEVVENDKYITGNNCAGITGDIFKAG